MKAENLSHVLSEFSISRNFFDGFLYIEHNDIISQSSVTKEHDLSLLNPLYKY